MGIGHRYFTPHPDEPIFKHADRHRKTSPSTARFLRSIECLHQLCAFEHCFQRFLAILHNLKKPPVRASFELEYTLVNAYHTPSRSDNLDELSVKMHNITRSQRQLAHNLIPGTWMLAVEANFQAVLRSRQIRMTSCDELDGQAGLSRRQVWRPPGVKCPAPAHAGLDLSPIKLILFSFPRGVEDVKSLGFNHSLTFDYTFRDRVTLKREKRVLIGLGIARVLNHSCRPNVQWSFEHSVLRKPPWSASIHPSLHLDIMTISVPIGQAAAIEPGEQLFAFYGERFAIEDCEPSATQHKAGRDVEQVEGDCADYEYSDDSSAAFASDPEASDDEYLPTVKQHQRQRQRQRRR
ncbi:hypothetical protein IAU59_004253 [Kwoniella sp. CBS 9459]